jgi:signal transduction histidine kinase
MGRVESESPLTRFAATAAAGRIESAFRARLRRAAYVPLLVMVAFASVLAITVERLLSRADWVDHTHAVIAQANRCLLLAVDLETGMRGFQLTADRGFLAPFEAARAASDPAWQRLAALVSDNPRQLERVATLRREVASFTTLADGVIAQRRHGDAAAELPLNRELKARFDAIRVGFADLIAEEQRLLERRTSRLATGSRVDVMLRIGGAIAIGIALTMFVRRQLRQLSRDYDRALGELQQSTASLRASEEEYRQLNADLEKRVAERTHELLAVNERLKEVDRLKSEFLASMSHELRTPLNSIIGFNEIIHAGLAGPLNDEQKTQLGMALNSARHLLHLINDLLDLARIESGRVEPRRAWFDLRAVVEEVVGTLRPLATQKGLPVEAEIDGDSQVFSDRRMLFQILLNLTNNAVKFTEHGRIRVTMRRTSAALQVAVADTGPGIKPADIPLLFESFRQLPGSTRRHVEGTGLGLYLCQRLAGILGGEISVNSTAGKGSTFAVTLPAAAVAP